MLYLSIFACINAHILDTFNPLRKNKNAPHKDNIDSEMKDINSMIDKQMPFLNKPVSYYIGEISPKFQNLALDGYIDNFVYYFSFLSCYSLENLDVDVLKKELKHAIVSVETIKSIKLSSWQIWWLLVLEYIRILGDRHELFLIIDSATSLINKIETLTEKELSLYSNLLNNSLYLEVGEGLRVRPLLAKNIKSETLHENKYFLAWLNSYEKIIEIIEGYLTFSDFNSKLLKKEIGLISQLTVDYSKWDVFFEIFLSHIVAILCPEDDDSLSDSFSLKDIESSVAITLSKLTKKATTQQVNLDHLCTDISEFMFYECI